MSFERDNIRRMQGYTAGEQPEDVSTIKLNTNENPYPPSPAVDEVLASMRGADLRRYPQPTAIRFRQLAADRHNVTPEHIVATRGGDELLRLVMTTFVDPGETIAMTDPTYSLYPVLAEIQDCPVTRIPLQDDWTLAPDFADEVKAASAKLTLIVNPHAPSGRLLPIETVSEIAGTIDGLLLIDEAYIDFVDPGVRYDSSELVRDTDNVIVLRSLSKGYALAGLRFGYGIAAPELIAPMIGKTRDSYNLDHVSQQIAEVAFNDVAYAESLWKRVRSERTRMARALAQLGIPVHPSQSNFLLASVPATPGAETVYRDLKARGILVRYFAEPRLTDKLRITIGTPRENDALLDALSALV